jgi:hypothetical protein
MMMVVMLIAFLWNGIITARAPGMTARNPFYTQPDPFDHTPFHNCFSSVLRTRRCMSAMRTKHGGNAGLIKADGQYEKLS